MTLLMIVSIACGLAADAFAVSLTCGFFIKKANLGHGLKIGFFFGGFQALMPILGWGASLRLNNYLQNYHHWIAFLLLLLIGLRTIHESLEIKEQKWNPLDSRVLVSLAVATSIDAFAAGVSFAFLEVDIAQAVAVIGLITFVFCSCGVLIGNKGGKYFKDYAGLIGGIILIVIGLKILLA